MESFEKQKEYIQNQNKQKLNSLTVEALINLSNKWSSCADCDGIKIYYSTILTEYIERTNNEIEDLENRINRLESRIDFMDGSYDE